MNRRQVLTAAAVLPLVEMAEPESELIALCRRYVDLYREVDDYLAIPRSMEDQIAAEQSAYANDIWFQMREIDTQLSDMSATTLAELHWKAKAVSPQEMHGVEATRDGLEWSVMRDLLAMAVG